MGVMAELDMYRQRIEPLTGQAWQHVCVASLIGNCEAIAASGLLPEPSEQSLRVLIAETLSAFNMEPHQSAVKREMER